MSDWNVSKESTFLELLESGWFQQFLRQLSQFTPFSFWIKKDEDLLFSSNGLIGSYEKRKISCDSFELSLGISDEADQFPAQVKNAFVKILHDTINQQFQIEDELNSFSAEMLDRYEELNLIYELSHCLGAVFQLDELLDVLLEKIEAALDVDRISIMLFDEATEELVITAARGFDLAQLESHRMSLKEGISGYVLRRGEALWVENVNSMPKGFDTKYGDYKSESFISVPMILSHLKDRDIPVGVINVTEKRTFDGFTSGDLKLLNAIASFAAISIHNNRLVEKVRESERIKRELEIAETIQLGLLPSVFPHFPDLQIAGRCRSAKKVGGDYFDFVVRKERQLDLVIGDVSGHNVSAALMMAMTRSVLRSLMHEKISVSHVLRRANKLLFEDMNQTGFFISIFLMRYDRKTHTLTYANGGHHPVLWFQAKSGKIVPLDAEGLLLGVMSKVEFEEKSVRVEPDDILVMYTDGVVEASNSNGRMFGYGNLKRSVIRLAEKSAQEIVDAIFDRLSDFSQDKSQKDDITMQVLKFTR